jgi:hypothetical protein
LYRSSRAWIPLVSISMTAASKISIGMHQYSHFTITLVISIF